MIKYQGNLEVKFVRIIPFIIGFSISKINKKRKILSINITPFISITFGYRGTLNGCEIKNKLTF